MTEKRYEFSTPEGFTVKVDLVNEGLEDERLCQDWQIGFRWSAGYDLDSVDHYASGLYVRTSRDPRGR